MSKLEQFLSLKPLPSLLVSSDWFHRFADSGCFHRAIVDLGLCLSIFLDRVVCVIFPSDWVLFWNLVLIKWVCMSILSSLWLTFGFDLRLSWSIRKVYTGLWVVSLLVINFEIWLRSSLQLWRLVRSSPSSSFRLKIYELKLFCLLDLKLCSLIRLGYSS